MLNVNRCPERIDNARLQYALPASGLQAFSLKIVIFSRQARPPRSTWQLRRPFQVRLRFGQVAASNACLKLGDILRASLVSSIAPEYRFI
jgi:hypothetical protein